MPDRLQAHARAWVRDTHDTKKEIDPVGQVDRLLRNALTLARKTPGFNEDRIQALVRISRQRDGHLELGTAIAGAAFQSAVVAHALGFDLAEQVEGEIARRRSTLEADRAYYSKPPVEVLPHTFRFFQHEPVRTAQLLDELRKGPISTEDWYRFTPTRVGFRVRIAQLRKRGYVIDSVKEDTGSARQPAVLYYLRSEPGQ